VDVLPSNPIKRPAGRIFDLYFRHTVMSALTNERIIVKENDIVERQLSFDNVSVEPAQVKDYDAKPTTRKELIAWYQYSLAVSIIPGILPFDLYIRCLIHLVT
jgi:hypothetical protein